MTVSTFYPDGDPETNSVDGYTQHDENPPGSTWATARDGAGTASSDIGVSQLVSIRSTTTVNQWRTFNHIFLLFYTATLGDADTKDSATLEFVVIARIDQFAQSVALVTTTPASNTALVNGDHLLMGTVDQATDRTLAGLTVDSATYNAMTLNATGLTNISLTGVTKFGLRLTADADNVEPTWGSNQDSQIDVALAEENLAGDKRPKLVVTHTSPPFVPTVIVF